MSDEVGQSDAIVSEAALPILQQREAREWLSLRQAKTDEVLTLLIVGIKDLKQINDRLGRADGDAVIQKVGKSILQFANGKIENIRLIARLAGREFLLAVSGEEKEAREKAEKYATKLLTILGSDFGSAEEPLHISARVGIAIAAADEAGIDALHRASHALAKAYGRKGNRYSIADHHKSAAAHVSAALDADLRAAIKQRDITIMLQPQFAVKTGQLVGAEALARWHHPDLGEVGADALFAAADRCDLREELSYAIQQEAITIASNWPASLDPLRLSVNLGAEELTDNYADRLLELLEETGFPAERLTLELTEESLVRDIDLAASRLQQLRVYSIRIALDDFGTGYSSLAYLKDLPLDYLKIDKGMTPDISGTGKDRVVLRAIIAMGKALGLQIIAEGVERADELDMLQLEECDYFQGFLRSPPLSAEAFERFALRSD